MEISLYTTSKTTHTREMYMGWLVIKRFWEEPKLRMDQDHRVILSWLLISIKKGQLYNSTEFRVFSITKLVSETSSWAFQFIYLQDLDKYG